MGKWSHDGQDSVLLRNKKLELSFVVFKLKTTRTTLPESFIVGLCLIFELELDIDSGSKVLIGTKHTSKGTWNMTHHGISEFKPTAF